MAKKKTSSVVEQRLNKEEDFRIFSPKLAAFTLDPEEGFRGLTVFLGDTNNVVVGIKRFDFDGQAEVMWTSGLDLLDALVNLEAALSAGKWRIDKNFKK